MDKAKTEQEINQLTPAEAARLQAYLDKLEELERREPEQIPAETWDEVWPQIQATGEVPAAYKDRIGHGTFTDPATGETKTGYHDILWESWNSEQTALHAQYKDVIVKGLCFALESKYNGATIDVLGQILAERAATLPRVPAKKLKALDFPLDKVNSKVWNLFTENTDGQIKLNVDVSARDSSEPVNILYAMDFSALPDVTITKKLDPYDKRVYNAIGSIYNDGNELATLQQIYQGMGNTGRMSDTDRKKINASLTKMSSAHLFIDSRDESSKYNYKPFLYDSALLPMERISAVVNGKVVDSVIHIFREPPMMTFARERKQITTIAIKLLESPLNQTSQNIAIEDYLIERISHIKHGKINPKILYKTIYENAGITEKKQKQRAPAKIEKLLNHYKQLDFIKDFTLSDDGITIAY